MFRRDKRGAKTRRVCEKDGTANVKYKNISEKRRRYVYDIYTTLVDSSWTSSLFLFSMSFYVTWVGYAIAYWLIMHIHGDFAHCKLENDGVTVTCEDNWTPCILAVHDFSSAFLFSLETQHTIGYGSRQSTTECIDLIIICSTQSVLGCLIQAFMVGVVFAKLSVPNKRAKTVVFSKNGVICERDKKLCLQFRVGDMRNDSYIVGAAISAKVIRRRVSAEGEMYHDVTPLVIVPDTSNEPCMFLIWPFTVMHIIDKDSPFYNLSAPEIASDKFEVHLVLEGTIESTSMTFQARTSYLPSEIMWGHRFEPMMIYRKDHNKYQVNFSAFNSTYEVDTPLCSSKQLAAFYKSRAKYEKAANPPRKITGVARSALAPISGSPSTSLQQAKQRAAAMAACNQVYGYQAPLAGDEDDDVNGDGSSSSNESGSESSSMENSDASSSSSNTTSSITEEATAAAAARARLTSLGTDDHASSANGANAKGSFQ